jgi:hypothetical protein
MYELAAVGGGISVKPPEKVLEKWQTRAKAGASEYAYYVEHPKRSPTDAAISMRATLEAKMSQKATWDKWEQNRKAVGDAGWLYGIKTKGISRFPTGVDAGAPKFADFYRQFKAHLEAGLAKVYAMPRATIDDAVARAAAMIKHNATFRYAKKAPSV